MLHQYLNQPSHSYTSVRDRLVACLTIGAKNGQKTAMAFNRDLKEGIWSWLPVNNRLKDFLASLALKFPNESAQKMITKHVNGEVEKKDLEMQILDPDGKFSGELMAIFESVSNLFLGKYFAVKKFYDTYKENFREDFKEDVKTFTKECYEAYMGMLAGVLSNFILDKLKEKFNDPEGENDLTINLSLYYSSMIKIIFNQINEKMDNRIEIFFATNKVSEYERKQFFVKFHDLLQKEKYSDFFAAIFLETKALYDYAVEEGISTYDKCCLIEILQEKYKDYDVCMRLIDKLSGIMLDVSPEVTQRLQSAKFN